MSKINLLPWRAELRARQKKQFLASLGMSALAGLVSAGLIFFYYSSHVSGQMERNAYLEDQIALGEKKIEQIKDLDAKKQRLINRKQVIDTLQADRSRVVRLFESLVKATPDGVVLTLVKQNESGMVIEGRAQSNTRVSTYLRNLEASGWMKNPDLSVIEATSAQPGFEAFPYEFKLSVGLAKSDELTGASVVDASQVAPDPADGSAVPLTPIPVDAIAPATPATSSTPDVASPGAATPSASKPSAPADDVGNAAAPSDASGSNASGQSADQGSEAIVPSNTLPKTTPSSEPHKTMAPPPEEKKVKPTQTAPSTKAGGLQ